MNLASIPPGLPEWLTLGFLIVTATIGVARLTPGLLKEVRSGKSDKARAEEARIKLEMELEDRRRADTLAALGRAQEERERAESWYEQLYEEKRRNTKLFEENMRLTREGQWRHEQIRVLSVENTRLKYQITLFEEFIQSDRASDFTRSAWNRLREVDNRAAEYAQYSTLSLPGPSEPEDEVARDAG